jgi:hypothetical protein
VGPEVIAVILQATDFANDLKNMLLAPGWHQLWDRPHRCRPGGVLALVGAARREWNPFALYAWSVPRSAPQNGTAVPESS